jgi:hypothetical protein
VIIPSAPAASPAPTTHALPSVRTAPLPPGPDLESTSHAHVLPADRYSRDEPAISVDVSNIDCGLFAEREVGGELPRPLTEALALFWTVDALEPNADGTAVAKNGDGVSVGHAHDLPRETLP